MIAVIFEVEPANGNPEPYLAIAAGLIEELRAVDGFISVERFQSLSNPGKLLSLSFWMTALTTVAICLLAWLLERDAWREPDALVWGAIAYNAIGAFGFAQPAWFYLARGLPPVASSISVMMIPVLGTYSGAWLLGEALHWQDYAAMAAIVASIALVLQRRPSAG